jgi:hypothetical protein
MIHREINVVGVIDVFTPLHDTIGKTILDITILNYRKEN